MQARDFQRAVDQAEVHRKRRNAREALGLYADFLKRQGLARPQAALPSIAAALERGHDHDALEWWRRYRLADLHERYAPLCRKRIRRAARDGLADEELRYHVLRNGAGSTMAHLRVYLEHGRQRPLVDLSEESIRGRMADQLDAIRRQARRQQLLRRRVWAAVLTVVAMVAWLVL